MARIRTVKPDVARHEGLFGLERETGLRVYGQLAAATATELLEDT